MIAFETTGSPFDVPKTFRIVLGDYVVEHRAEVPLTWDQIARLAADEHGSAGALGSAEIAGVEDGSPVLVIYKV